MNDRSFIDTNIFIYASGHHGEPQARVAQGLVEGLIEKQTGVISYQVIQEFLNVALKKFAVPMSLEQAQNHLVNVFRSMFIVHSSLALYHDALEIFKRYKLSWYDSLLIAAAAEAGCSILYTEDMQHGAVIRGVKIVNPFLTN